MSALIGVDVGATAISGGLVSGGGEVLYATRRATPGDGRTTAVDTVLAIIEGLVAEARLRRVALEGIGVGLPGLVDADRGMMVSSANVVPEFAQLPLVDHLHRHTGLATFVDNDANVLALGEWMFGLGRGAASLVLFAVGTGVGGGIISGNTLLRGHGGCAGELGHMSIDLNGPACVCGGRGCLDRYLGGRHIAREGQRRAAADSSSALLARVGGDPRSISTELVFEAAGAGDGTACAIVDDACRALGAGIGAIVNLLNPEVIVVTGGVARSLAPLEAEVRRYARSYALARAFADTTIHIVTADKIQTVRGGAALVRYELERRHGLGEPKARDRRATTEV